MDTMLGPGGTRKMFGPGGTEQPRPTNNGYDFSKSNLILMVGGQILLLAFLLMIVVFGTAPLSFPANAVKNMLSRNNSKT